MEMYTGTATMENSMEAPQKLRIGPATPFLGIYPKELKTFICKDICTPMFTAALFMVAKTWEQQKCPSVDDWIKKMWDVYTMKWNTIQL